MQHFYTIRVINLQDQGQIFLNSSYYNTARFGQRCSTHTVATHWGFIRMHLKQWLLAIPHAVLYCSPFKRQSPMQEALKMIKCLPEKLVASLRAWHDAQVQKVVRVTEVLAHPLERSLERNLYPVSDYHVLGSITSKDLRSNL